MKVVHDYLKEIVQLNNEFPYLKSELDHRIQNLICRLNDQSKEDQEIIDFTSFFTNDIISVNNNNDKQIKFYKENAFFNQQLFLKSSFHFALY